MSYPGGRVGRVEDRLLALAERRPWAMSGDELVAAFDQAHLLRCEADAILLRMVRQIDREKAADAVAATSTAVWYRNRHRVSIRTAHRWLRVAKRVAAASWPLPEAAGRLPPRRHKGCSGHVTGIDGHRH